MWLRGRGHGGIAKLRVDWGRVINVGEAAAAAVEEGGGDGLPKELEGVLGGTSCMFST